MHIRFRSCLEHMPVYTPGKAIPEVQQALGLHDVIKMASNENPLGSSVSWEDLKAAYSSIHLYPHQPSSGLVQKLSQKWQLSTDCFMLGNGSDEVIQLIALAVLNPGDHVLTSSFTFSEYEFATHLMNAKLETVPMTKDYRYDLSGIISRITANTKLIFIANPNNPTGTYISHTELSSFLNQVPSDVAVILDEAYAEYATAADFPQSVSLMARHSNLVVLRTFSKCYGLAGFRVGYGIAHPEFVAGLLKVRMPFNVNNLALVAAGLALENTAHIQKTLELNQNGMAFLISELQALGYETLPSQGNFVAFLGDFSSKKLAQLLLNQGIIVRSLSSFGLDNGIRVTIGLPEHNQRFIDGLKQIL